jgi:hypothetical protein
MIGSLAHVLLSVDLYRYPRETGRKAEMGVRVEVGRTRVVMVLEGIVRGVAIVRRDMIVRFARDAILTGVYIRSVGDEPIGSRSRRSHDSDTRGSGGVRDV